MSAIEGINTVVDLIRAEFIPRTRFTADDVYCHNSGPLDGDMYMALGILVKLEEIVDINSVHDDTPRTLTHDDMIYCIPGEDGYRPCFCRDCMELAIGLPGEMCSECEHCDPTKECQAPGAYGGDE